MTNRVANFSVIIPTLNRPKILGETLLSVFSQNLLPAKVYVVDQSDGNDTKEVCARFPDVEYIYSDKKSLTLARNIGIKKSVESNFDFWAMLDDDVELYPDYFSIIYKCFSTDRDIVGIAAWVNTLTPAKWSVWCNTLRFLGGFDYASDKMKIRSNFLATHYLAIPKEMSEIQWMPGNAMAIRNLRENNLFFDEELILYALAEDRDFSYRLSQKGRTVLIPSLQLLHKATLEGRIPSRKKTFMIAVHQYYLIKKHFGRSKRSAAMYWWNMSFRYIISLSVSLNGLLCRKPEIIASGKDIRDSFYYVLENRGKLKKLDMSDFHSFLLEKGDCRDS